MKNPKVTIYITNHNYGDYIEKSIFSVLRQTFKDFELIIIDDGSKDNSKKIINKFLITNPEIIYISQKNRGLIVSNNVALNLAKGKYIMRLDADDWLHKDALMRMVKFLDSNNKVGLVFPDYYEVNERGLIIHKIQRHNFNKVKKYDQYLLYLIFFYYLTRHFCGKFLNFLSLNKFHYFPILKIHYY